MTSLRKRNAAPYLLVVLATALLLTGAAYRGGWKNLWLKGDQRGRFLMDHARPSEAAVNFRDPMWRGVALFRSGDFKAAAESFAGVDTAEGAYNQGNALVMLGKYDDAVARYDRALALRPEWPAAAANRRLARIRAARLHAKGGEEGDPTDEPDDVVYDKTKKGGADAVAPTDTPAMSDEQIRAMWLKRVQTRPGDFLRAKFAYQLRAATKSVAVPNTGPSP